MLLAIDFDIIFGQVGLGQPHDHTNKDEAEQDPEKEVDLVAEDDPLTVLDCVGLEPLAVEVG